jgi:hypothetical protein
MARLRMKGGRKLMARLSKSRLYYLVIRCYYCRQVRRVSLTLDQLIDAGIEPERGKYEYFKTSRVPCQHCMREGVRIAR